jgi:hypothetical protein
MNQGIRNQQNVFGHPAEYAPSLFLLASVGRLGLQPLPAVSFANVLLGPIALIKSAILAAGLLSTKDEELLEG